MNLLQKNLEKLLVVSYGHLADPEHRNLSVCFAFTIKGAWKVASLPF